MDPKKATIISTSVVISLIVTVGVLARVLGLTKKFFIIASACIAAILAVFAWLLHQFMALDRRRRVSMLRRVNLEGRQLRQDYSFLRKVAGVPVKFKLDMLAAATDDFRTVIGRGSSSTVFKGVLEDGAAVAVKRIDAAPDEDRGDCTFRAEVSAIASLQHVNLVRLLGYCVAPDGARFLVYEYVENGSLDKWIFCNHQGSGLRADGDVPGCLPWKVRYKIAADVAKALSYLHNDCRNRILHLDVKPENILLDGGFNACVSDFGLSKLMSRDQSRVLTTLRGTRGYLAPEWLVHDGVTERSDVYSYGMVLFELVGGRRNLMVVDRVDGDGVERRTCSYFPSIVMEKAREGNVMEVVDERLMACDVVEEKEVRTLVWIALWCVQEDVKLRPSMARVVDMLAGRLEVPRPPETEMVIVDLLMLGGTGQSSGTARLPAPLQLQSTTFDSIFSTMSAR